MEETDMNYTWKLIVERGQLALGYVDVFDLKGHGHAIVIIKYLAQHSSDEERVIKSR